MSAKTSLDTTSTLKLEVEEIHNFLQNGDKQIKYSPNKDIVLLLGNTGSGKSTLTQYISSNAHTLWSQEVEEGTGEFVIIDTQNKVSSNSTLLSQTIYPDLVEDAKTKTLYYDCPGFSDTRSAAHEIAATYFIKNVIDSARSVKMVFVVSHNSVSRGADRQDFILMLQHATDFIKQIEKYKNSIALAVTKVENRYVGNKIVSDEKVIKAIGHYLEQAKRDIEEHPRIVTSRGQSSDTEEKVLSLLDIFLTKGEDEQYTKIGIFRSPNEPGKIINIKLMNEGIIPLENLINKKTQYVEASDKDFGYTVSAKSKIHINALSEEIKKTIVKEIVNMGKEVEKFCIAQEETVLDLEYVIYLFQKLSESFLKIQGDAATPENFISEIDKNIKYFKIEIPDHQIKTVQREGDYIKFLNLVSNQSVKSHKSSLLDFSKLTEYLSNSHSFYNFMNSLYTKLLEFGIQKNRSNYSTINVNDLEDFYDCPFFNEIKELFKKHNGITKINLEKPKLRLLNRILDQTLRYQIEQTSPQSDKFIVKGVIVKLSDLSELLRNQNIKFLEVYALHKVFIDTSLDLTGREIQMTIVAPVWEVIGSQSIILDGKPGRDYYEKAKSGVGYGQNGLDGIPGEPGGPAGNFIGIGKQYFNEKNLHVSANGGNGGRGQDGGDGTKGFDGDECHQQSCKELKDVIFTFIFNGAITEYTSGEGGNGGNGGLGGEGGHKGKIYMIKVGTESGAVQAKQTAQDGYPGKEGIGGSGGKGGRYYRSEKAYFFAIKVDEKSEPLDKRARDGISGKDGTNRVGRKNTWKLTKFIDTVGIKTKAVDYLQDNLKSNLQQKLLTTFLTEIKTDLRIMKQIIDKDRKRRSISFSTSLKKSEKQMRNIKNDKHDPIEFETQRYDNYYLDLDNSADNKPVFSDIYSKIVNIKQTLSRSILSTPMQLENMKTEKDINIIDQYSSTNLHGNLLLAEMALKKLMGKEIPPSHSHKGRPKEGTSSAHDLAYSHYLPN